MPKVTEIEQVKDVLLTFFEGLDGQNRTTIRQIWHPEARLFLNNAVPNTRSLPFLLGLPDAMDFSVREIKQVNVQNVIASARVDYRMSIGVHAGFFNLIKIGGQWRIVNWVDHGLADN